jgi:tol-pal system protein YbgF
MKRRAFIPLLSILAAIIAFAGWGVVWLPEVKAQTKPAPQTAKAQPGGDANERIARLEQRILDMQSVIATLQSFVKGGGGGPVSAGVPSVGGPPAGGAPSEVNIRVLALETQIRAISGQMEQLSQKLSQLPAGAGVGVQPLPPGGQSAVAPQLAPQTPGQPGQLASSAQPVPQFGTMTSGPPPANPFEKVLRPGSAPKAPSAPRQSAALPPLPGLPAGSGGARGIYDASYQNFLRNDLRAAEQGFSSFVKTYPDDPLAGNAYYWLGRTHFERKKFEPAAKAFLAGYKKGKKSAIAPDALLHLGMSLAQLGEKDAACSTLKAISKQFPDAPGNLKKDASSALKRARC